MHVIFSCISGTDLLKSDNCTRCHSKTKVADKTCWLTQSKNTDTGPTRPGTDPITQGPWQDCH